jgi:UTP--glucose-1-phosphate uridylyltransferase
MKKFGNYLSNPPGAGNEIQLTDAIASLMNQEQVDAFYMTGMSHDCGSKLGYMNAFFEFSLRVSEMVMIFRTGYLVGNTFG